MKRFTKAMSMIAIACSGTVMGLNGCLIQEARDSCVVNFLDGHLTGECVIDIELPEGFGD